MDYEPKDEKTGKYRLKKKQIPDLWPLRCLSCPLSSDPKAETRLYVTVNGFEFHVYNRTDLYARLQETFGLEPTLLTPKKDEERGREDRNKTLDRYD